MWIKLLLALSTYAFHLEPMVVTVPLKSPQANATYTVENSTKEKIALQFEVRERLIRKDGKEERPEVKGFSIYPSQLSLEPGEKRNVRVSWKGENLPNSELAYRFIATQLPLDFQKEREAGAKTKLKFLLEYVASLYLVPPGVAPKVRVVSTEIRGQKLFLLLKNEGSAHQLLEKMEIQFQLDGKNEPLNSKDLNDVRSENILAGGERELVIPIDKKYAKAKIKVSFPE